MHNDLRMEKPEVKGGNYYSVSTKLFGIIEAVLHRRHKISHDNVTAQI